MDATNKFNPHKPNCACLQCVREKLGPYVPPEDKSEEAKGSKTVCSSPSEEKRREEKNKQDRQKVHESCCLCLECVRKRQSIRQSDLVRQTLSIVREELENMNKPKSNKKQTEYERYKKMIEPHSYHEDWDDPWSTKDDEKNNNPITSKYLTEHRNHQPQLQSKKGKVQDSPMEQYDKKMVEQKRAAMTDTIMKKLFNMSSVKNAGKMESIPTKDVIDKKKMYTQRMGADRHTITNNTQKSGPTPTTIVGMGMGTLETRQLGNDERNRVRNRHNEYNDAMQKEIYAKNASREETKTIKDRQIIITSQEQTTPKLDKQEIERSRAPYRERSRSRNRIGNRRMEEIEKRFRNDRKPSGERNQKMTSPHRTKYNMVTGHNDIQNYRVRSKRSRSRNRKHSGDRNGETKTNDTQTAQQELEPTENGVAPKPKKQRQCFYKTYDQEKYERLEAEYKRRWGITSKSRSIDRNSNMNEDDNKLVTVQQNNAEVETKEPEKKIATTTKRKKDVETRRKRRAAAMVDEINNNENGCENDIKSIKGNLEYMDPIQSTQKNNMGSIISKPEKSVEDCEFKTNEVEPVTSTTPKREVRSWLNQRISDVSKRMEFEEYQKKYRNRRSKGDAQVVYLNQRINLNQNNEDEQNNNVKIKETIKQHKTVGKNLRHDPFDSENDTDANEDDVWMAAFSRETVRDFFRGEDDGEKYLTGAPYQPTFFVYQTEVIFNNNSAETEKINIPKKAEPGAVTSDKDSNKASTADDTDEIEKPKKPEVILRDSIIKIVLPDESPSPSTQSSGSTKDTSLSYSVSSYSSPSSKSSSASVNPGTPIESIPEKKTTNAATETQPVQECTCDELKVISIPHQQRPGSKTVIGGIHLQLPRKLRNRTTVKLSLTPKGELNKDVTKTTVPQANLVQNILNQVTQMCNPMCSYISPKSRAIEFARRKECICPDMNTRLDGAVKCCMENLKPLMRRN